MMHYLAIKSAPRYTSASHAAPGCKQRLGHRTKVTISNCTTSWNGSRNLKEAPSHQRIRMRRNKRNGNGTNGPRLWRRHADSSGMEVRDVYPARTIRHVGFFHRHQTSETKSRWFVRARKRANAERAAIAHTQVVDFALFGRRTLPWFTPKSSIRRDLANQPLGRG